METDGISIKFPIYIFSQSTATVIEIGQNIKRQCLLKIVSKTWG